MKRNKQKGTSSGVTRRLALSLCMIVKNEEANLGRCLESVKGVADEIIIVDTGSTDRTVGIARQYGAKIFSHQWNEDFAAARNVSLQSAASDWILVLDADEALAEEDQGRLRALLRQDGPTAYLLNIVSPVNDRRSSHAVINAFPRLFRNHPEIRFEGRCHEQVSPSIARIGGTVSPSEIRVHHRGYHGLWVDLPAKRQRNIRLLSKQLVDHPDDPSAHFHLGEVYALEGRIGEAIASYRAALSLPGLPPANRSVTRRSLASCLLNRQRYEESWQECGLALKEDPRYAMPHLTGAIALGKLGRFETAVEQIDLYLAKANRKGRSIQGVLAHEPNQAYALSFKGNCLFALREVDRALDCYRTALSFDQDSPDGHLGMGKIHRLQGQAQEAAAALEKAATLFEQMPHGYLALAETYAELGRWSETLAACEQFLQACPEDTGGLDLQAQALLKLGRPAEAEAIYRRLVNQAPSGMAYFALACLADTHGDRPGAAVFCRKAWEFEQTDARIPFLLGCCLIEAGEYREALAALLEAERLAPGTPEITERLKLLGRLLKVGAPLAAPGAEREVHGTPHPAPRIANPPVPPLCKGGVGVFRTPHPVLGTGMPVRLPVCRTPTGYTQTGHPAGGHKAALPCADGRSPPGCRIAER
ncbi:tetratricopeptide repeat-containing glycosyltransferase family 2 protein [Candidatus Methylomirabilis sp.]|uniref:tetratricopeptide repeat-containing glycosyltransferase family 2 protein n=1 Tax=Candidatus Methylomirabilis sp. TaxID=2032687 RepID=UPI003C70AAC9